MHEVISLTMLREEDICALRRFLRRMYRTEKHACCQSLLSLSYIGFEQKCRAALRGGSDTNFSAHVYDGLKLEYSAQRVVVKCAWASLPTSESQNENHKRERSSISDSP